MDILTSEVCKILQHLITAYRRDGLESKELLFQNQHGFLSVFSREGQIINVSRLKSLIFTSEYIKEKYYNL